jgi:hypothetical protein
MSFGADFAPEDRHIRSGIERIVSKTNLTAAVRRKLYSSLRPAIVSGDPAQEKRAISSALRGVEWSWAWLDECAAEFRSLSIWPACWPSWGLKESFSWPRIRPRTRNEIFGATVGGAIYADMHAANLLPVLKQQSSMEPIIRPSNLECPAERVMADRHGQRIAALDFSLLPPFFPLDGSRVTYIR